MTTTVTETDAREAVRTILRFLGEDPDREGLQGTPGRVIRAWTEMTEGYGQEPAKVLKTSDGKDGFNDVAGYDGMVVLSDIPFHSTCEHHMLPFTGLADVGYIPAEGGPVVGLSKLARLVDVFARRLQVQEKMTAEIAKSLQEELQPLGVAVRLRATHQCMTCRGVRKTGASMGTAVLLGRFRDHAVRAEFWNLCGGNR